MPEDIPATEPTPTSASASSEPLRSWSRQKAGDRTTARRQGLERRISSDMGLHLLSAVAVAAVLLVGMFPPFLPGQPDRFAVTLSMAVQACGFVGLLLVPIGLAWQVGGWRWRARTGRTTTRGRRSRLFPILAWCAASLMAFAVAVTVFTVSVSLGVVAVALWLYASRRFVRWLKHRNAVESSPINPAPIYLVVIPLVLVFARLMYFERAIEFSRRRAIANSAEFIRDIERYHAEHGRYPLSLAGLVRDYKPNVIGIERYGYEPNGEAYNVFFEQFASAIGTQEIVMFNKRDEHAAYCHPIDRLEHTGEALRLRSGWHAVHDAGVPHWKYFWFD